MAISRSRIPLVAVTLALAGLGSGHAENKGPSGQEAKPGQAPARVSIEPRAKPGAEPPPGERRGGANIRIDSTLVLINVTVTDPLNRFVTGLDKDYFRLWEDNAEQSV